jgi:hypothetical protein
MRCLSALCLGPLLARAAPRIGGGSADSPTRISQWLNERLFHPSGTLASVLTRVVDRAWRALEIALAGERLHRLASESGADRALVEQLRQFLAVAPLFAATPQVRKFALIDIENARQAELIPGPVPSAAALAAQVLRFLRGPDEETPEADARELATMAPEFREAGFPALADFLEMPLSLDDGDSADLSGMARTDLARFVRPASAQAHLLVSAARYFLSRAIAADLWLMRDLRFTRTDLMPDRVRAGYDRLNDALDRFTPVIVELLFEVAAGDAKPEPPSISAAVSAETPAAPAAEDPGFAIHGVHLVAPIRTDASGNRVAPCPVCLTQTPIPAGAKHWASLRCETCGTEYRATDGTAPAPPPPPPPIVRPDAAADAAMRKLQAGNLALWINSGEPLRWIENRRGVWSEKEFRGLVEMLRLSRFWPMNEAEVRKYLVDLALRYETRGASWSAAPVHAPPPPPPASVGLIRTSDIYRTIDGNLWVPCPICRSFNVGIPAHATGEVGLTCPGCGRRFIAILKKKPSLLPPPLPPPPPPPPTIWSKVRKWFGT